jgi:hypothetical protein
MFTYKFEYTVIECDSLHFSDEEIKDIANEYKDFIVDMDYEDYDVFRDFLSDYIYDLLPCAMYNITDDNIGEFYKIVKKEM